MPRRHHFQFNTAMLLGAMASIAALCVLWNFAPAIFGILFWTGLSSAYVAWVAFLIAGAWESQGRHRLFFLTSLASLIAAFFREFHFSTAMNNALSGVGVPVYLVLYPTEIARLVLHVALSLLGGWIALRAASFWHDERTPNK